MNHNVISEKDIEQKIGIILGEENTGKTTILVQLCKNLFTITDEDKKDPFSERALNTDYFFTVYPENTTDFSSLYLLATLTSI